MPNPKFTTVDEYISSFPEDIKKRLSEVRKIIQKAIPKAEELISYNIPVYKYEGRWLIYFSAYKAHISIAMPPTGWYKEFEKELKDYKTSKSTFQYLYTQDTPTELITNLAKFRFNEKEKILPRINTTKKSPKK